MSLKKIIRCMLQTLELNIYAKKEFYIVKNILPRLLVIFIVILIFQACAAEKNGILPTKSDRLSRVDLYKSCVASATQNGYNSSVDPASIVNKSMHTCRGTRAVMVREYPPEWRESFARDIDAELYQREIDWIMAKRGKN